MNKGGGGSGSGGGGPTAAAAAQKQKTLLQRVDNDIGNIVDNFSFLVNVARVNDPPVRNSQEAFMMEMRAARMAREFLLSLKESYIKGFILLLHIICNRPHAFKHVQAVDSLLKLVSELKQTAIFSGFASLNDNVEQRIDEFNQQAEKATASLKELESHYYSSALRTSQLHQP
ncbi:hypothetical protein RHGRI_009173 [Rhododendron griersonianum]|uniref:Mediator of RNA polymerase II transcription subunit 22 n=1 Tax=Rhododendron griersonianum TaxID=479676 RepID=A0AAV6L572_9ERIC|nr:hypothetical protein RHGRI_009173 [Rhododendron griersonianum]